MLTENGRVYKEEIIHRTQNKFYLSGNRKHSSTEYFKVIAKPLFRGDPAKVLDLGCATVDFLYHNSQKFHEAALSGKDVDGELLAPTTEEVPEPSFINGDITDRVFTEGFDRLKLRSLYFR